MAWGFAALSSAGLDPSRGSGLHAEPGEEVVQSALIRYVIRASGSPRKRSRTASG